MIEGPPNQPWMTALGDWKMVVEACFGARTSDALLHPENLPPAFYDLSSRFAGEYLQKWRNYRIRVALVAAPGTTAVSSRFGEMVAEEAGRRDFRLFETREAAVAWLEDVGDEAGGG
jgi:hypothetical protein